MKAVVDGHIIAESIDVVENGGYQYFPPSAVQMHWLEKAPKTASDLECPHGVQFYDVVIDGVRHVRNAWVYESPQPAKKQIANRVGFWKDTKII
jgi:uncharacterized protein (DUF427 family)